MKQSLLIIFVSLSIMASCIHETIQPNNSNNNTNNPIDTTNNNQNPCSPDTVYFKNEILPIILSNCTMSGCHNSNDNADGVTLVDYNSIKNDGDVSPFNPNSSELYVVLIENNISKRMPYNLPPLSATDIAKIKKWIEQGALNNECTDCDTSGTMTYTNHIAPILQTNCNGCHNASNPSAGIDVSTYNSLSIIVNNGKLNGAINHLSGFSPMPKNAQKMSDCNIAKITKWINNGAPNN
ncbi:MAG: hypothetical protein R2831_06090 [Chitinophagaceae bacterium]